MAQQIEKSIVIESPATTVWNILTDPHLSREWIQEWWPEFMSLESNWLTGEPVVWKIHDGLVAAKGTVTHVEPFKKLEFSFRVSDPSFVEINENITYRLESAQGLTRLFVVVGEFGDSPDQVESYADAVESWNRSLPKIKELAERHLH